MGSLFLIDIAGTIHLVFSLKDRIIIHHMVTLLNYLMVVRLTEPSSNLIILWLESLSRFMLMVGPDRKSTRLNSSHSGESRMPSSA